MAIYLIDGTKEKAKNKTKQLFDISVLKVLVTEFILSTVDISLLANILIPISIFSLMI